MNMTRLDSRARSLLLSFACAALFACTSSLPVKSAQTSPESQGLTPKRAPLIGMAAATCEAPEVYFPQPFEEQPALEVISPATRIMSSGISCVRAKLAEARQANAVFRARCLNDKLNQLGLARRSWDERVEKLNRALGNAALAEAAQEYASLKIISERSRSVANDAATCIESVTHSAVASAKH